MYELFTLDEYYYDVFDRKECKINFDVYNSNWQELIDLLLKRDYSIRPDIDKVIEFIKSIKTEDKNSICLMDLLKDPSNLNISFHSIISQKLQLVCIINNNKLLINRLPEKNR